MPDIITSSEFDKRFSNISMNLDFNINRVNLLENSNESESLMDAESGEQEQSENSQNEQDIDIEQSNRVPRIQFLSTDEINEMLV